ncbi:hypothetical protein PhaeoP23_01526 [Phaeobacter piscinae]|uniref:Transposase n=1 Tax=Phaeobacter piscinae TaxID=1580596 RepID=A0ABM6PDA1_9RHOB|nr:hypothetical protein PhaeoP36_01526 [Phaeobacter piscinae]AUQ86194.1 hypothetical protein PhaeoP42_01527 [Phaeobacter piscinae]AUR24077.1 hypothetical protein PhaeoP23_01526 [Phaeobacter piscinae]
MRRIAVTGWVCNGKKHRNHNSIQAFVIYMQLLWTPHDTP